mgnify:CR=1 FL=1
MKKINYIYLLVIVITTAILLIGYSFAGKDEQKIIKYLNQEYGEDAYTMQEGKEQGKWDIILKEYPNITFHFHV